MVTKTTVAPKDDLDGGAADKTVPFAIDGARIEGMLRGPDELRLPSSSSIC